MHMRPENADREILLPGPDNDPDLYLRQMQCDGEEADEMKVILIPARLNPASDPPENDKPVFVQYIVGEDSTAECSIMAYDQDEKEWFHTSSGDSAFIDAEHALDSIKGWAAIVQQ